MVATDPAVSTAVPVAGARPSRPARSAVRVFVSYAHADAALHLALSNHLAALRREGWIAIWDDREIQAGDEWAQAIDARLDQADVILLFVTAAFIASDYCSGIEVERALARHHDPADRAVVIPVIVDDCDWQQQPFAKLQALPRGAKPASDWPTPAKHHTAVARGLRERLRKMADAEQSLWDRTTGRLRDPRWWQLPRVWGTAFALVAVSAGVATGLAVWSARVDRDLGQALTALRSGRYSDADQQVIHACGGPASWWPMCDRAKSKVALARVLGAPDDLKGAQMERFEASTRALRLAWPDDPDIVYIAAAVQLRSRAVASNPQQAANALAGVRRAITLAGGNARFPEAAFYLAGVFMGDQRFDVALPLLDGAIDGNPKSAVYLSARAYARLRNGDLAGAIADERDAAQDLGSIGASVELSTLLWHGPDDLSEDERLHEAVRHLDRAIVDMDARKGLDADRRPWQYELGDSQDPLTLESWGEKRCFAQLLRQSTLVLQGAASIGALESHCGSNAGYMPKAVRVMLDLGVGTAPARATELRDALKRLR